ncbi:hypothetical protein G8A07_25085 [Roseateles sp. DAIF2]|nr:hypothetical protein [Roseateles sp. DAIF2]QPF75863.1 hypothetical protein G8A07_25085 [Roseateles sp. DAIF2]
MIKRSLSQALLHSPRAHAMGTALKAVTLVAAVWGLGYPALLWSLGKLVH